MRTHHLAVAVAFSLASGLVGAHGTESHGKPKASVAQAAEQMPWGIQAAPHEVSQTIEVRMSDAMRFSPEKLQFKEGEVVRFVIHNDGALLHEFVLGTKETNDEHAELMKRFPNMEHDEPYMAHVEPGKQGEILWRFNRAGDFYFACLIAGHYQAGMIGQIRVQAN